MRFAVFGRGVGVGVRGFVRERKTSSVFFCCLQRLFPYGRVLPRILPGRLEVAVGVSMLGGVAVILSKGLLLRIPPVWLLMAPVENLTRPAFLGSLQR